MLLGKNTSYPSTYSPQVLDRVKRSITRESLGITDCLPFKGSDIWNAWEISWIDNKGKPKVASGKIEYSADSEFIVESKSFKLYLNSLNQTKFESKEEVEKLITEDLSALLETKVKVNLYLHKDNWPELKTEEGACIDELDVEISEYQLNSDLLLHSVKLEDEIIEEQVYSHLFKSNCMVTGQPDWASVFISYTGKPINHENLLRYLISFRNHQAFHEPCTEQIFVDVMRYCQPSELSVYCRFTRRGGLDINPFRSTNTTIPDNLRVWRQ